MVLRHANKRCFAESRVPERFISRHSKSGAKSANGWNSQFTCGDKRAVSEHPLMVMTEGLNGTVKLRFYGKTGAEGHDATGAAVSMGTAAPVAVATRKDPNMQKTENSTQLVDMIAEVMSSCRIADTAIAVDVIPGLKNHQVEMAEEILAIIQAQDVFNDTAPEQIARLLDVLTARIRAGTKNVTVMEDHGHDFLPVQRRVQDETAENFSRASVILNDLMSAIHVVLDRLKAECLLARLSEEAGDSRAQ